MVRAILLFIGLLLTPATFALQVTASIDKNPVVANESFVLEVVADDDVNTNALDTSSLMQDFIVGRTSVSTQTSMINFKTTRTTKWSTVLIARKAGTYTIPALNVEGEQTTPIALTVLAAADPSASKQQDLFITTDISAKEIYVQQQVTLTVKLHFATELKRGSLTEPSLENANITQVGTDKESDTIINGKRYRVIERTYAISPQQSGELILKTPVFSGEILVQTNRRSSFLSFGETKPVSVIGEDITLNVRPIPLDYQGQWLPSELLTMHQEWQPANDEFKVGEPMTRTLTLTAAGLSEEQLPELNMIMPPGLKVYPDQATLHTGMNNNRLVSQKAQNFAIVASRAGEYKLPEITIPWWNTVTNKFQKAVIPAQTIKVKANTDFNPSTFAPAANEQSVSNQAPATVIVKEASYLQWVFLTLWLLTSFAWFISYQRNKTPTKPGNKAAKTNDCYLNLMSACKQNDGEKALKLIVPWAKTLNGLTDISTLEEATSLINLSEFTQAIQDLQQCYYGKSATQWQGQLLLQLIQQVNKNQPKINSNTPLSLNP